jgi:hypothetical protein
MSDDLDKLKAAQALSQEIDRGFPSIPQSQLDDLIPLDEDDDEAADHGGQEGK